MRGGASTHTIYGRATLGDGLQGAPARPPPPPRAACILLARPSARRAARDPSSFGSSSFPPSSPLPHFFLLRLFLFSSSFGSSSLSPSPLPTFHLRLFLSFFFFASSSFPPPSPLPPFIFFLPSALYLRLLFLLFTFWHSSPVLPSRRPLLFLFFSRLSSSFSNSFAYRLFLNPFLRPFPLSQFSSPPLCPLRSLFLLSLPSSRIRSLSLFFPRHWFYYESSSSCFVKIRERKEKKKILGAQNLYLAHIA